MRELNNQFGNEVVIPPGKANRSSFILFGIAVIAFGIPFILIWGPAALLTGFKAFLTDYATLALVIIGGMLAHEFLHAATFAVFSREGWRAVSFGVKWKHLAPYVHCRDTLSVTHYSVATLMPGVVLGILPSLISILTGSAWLLTFGFFFTAGAAGDFLSFRELSKLHKHSRVKDHPGQIGFIITE